MVKFIKSKSVAVKVIKNIMILLENLCQNSTKLLSLKTGFGSYQLRSGGAKNTLTNLF